MSSVKSPGETSRFVGTRGMTRTSIVSAISIDPSSRSLGKLLAALRGAATHRGSRIE